MGFTEYDKSSNKQRRRQKCNECAISAAHSYVPVAIVAMPGIVQYHPRFLTSEYVKKLIAQNLTYAR